MDDTVQPDCSFLSVTFAYFLLRFAILFLKIFEFLSRSIWVYTCK